MTDLACFANLLLLLWRSWGPMMSYQNSNPGEKSKHHWASQTSKILSLGN